MTNIALAIVSRDGRYLILKRSPLDESNPSRWGLPGGHVEPQEQVMDGLIRELKEETDLETLPQYCRLIKAFQYKGKMLNFYWIQKSRRDVKLKDGEHTEFVWCSLNAIKMYNPLPYMFEMIKEIEEIKP